MLFTSYGFFGFLLILFLLYYTIPRRFQWVLLLLGSYLFYCISGPTNLVYILCTTLTTWYAARRIAANQQRQKAYLREHKEDLSREEKKSYREGQKKIRRRWVAGCLLLNLAVLGVVKYTGFVIANLNGILHAFGGTVELTWASIALPMGISFYTFMAIGYLIDVYRETVPAEQNPFRFALFVSFFPQLVQGPIGRYGDLAPGLLGEHPFDAHTVTRGLQRMLWGYFKKMVVADRVLTAVTTIIGDTTAYSGAYILFGMVLYTVELYADFTGGIDITIGIAEALGIPMAENFHRPYFSKSLKEYWRRWHITMCSWFRDYLFYPVSTSKWMLKITKAARSRLGERVGKRIPVYLCSFTVWLATGVWHGASWNFIVWGLANWVVLMLSEELEPLYAKFHARFPGLDNRNLPYKIFAVGRTFLLICVLNLFDITSSIGETFRALVSIFTAGNWPVLWDGSLLELGLTGLDYGIAGVACIIMLAVSLVQRRGSVRDKIYAKPYPVRFVLWYGLFLIVLLMGAYGIGYDASQFIYNRF